MRRTSKGIRGALRLAMLVVLAMGCSAQETTQGSSSAAASPTAAQQPAPPGQSGSAGRAAPTPESHIQPPSLGRKPDSAEQEENGEGLYVFKAEVQEVVLHATVMDEHHRPVTDLGRDAFRVLDGGRPQRISSFHREDIPVALAIVIDNSGSMRDKRPGVNTAALNLVRASNPQDQVCVVNFNNETYLDQDYTGDVGLLRDALERIESRGGTALYDALVATSDHLMKSAKLRKKAILVVTDGEDTASHDTLEQAVRNLAVDGGPAVYSIGLLGHEREKKAHRALRILAEQTGGVAYFPADLSEVESISQQIAHDIRNQYTIGFKPSTPMVLGAYHPVMVKAEAPGHKGLTVRTRSGYYVTGGQVSQ
jgi:Ca-activated chloride channel homolog